jgi:CRISPR-associated protein Cmr1
MANVQVQLRVVTPLFMGGAEPRGNPADVRALGVRGALRWWLRAAIGGGGGAGAAFSDTQALWRAEASVFGVVDSNQSSASPVVVLVQNVQGGSQPLMKDRPVRSGTPFNGRDYLLYGMHGNRNNPAEARQYYPPGTRFTLCLRPRLGAEGASAALERACAALWLLLMLGGLGARTRRGAGCLAVENVTGWPTSLPPLPPARDLQSPAMLLEVLQRGLDQIRKLFDQAPMENWSSSPFSVLHPEYFQVFLLDRKWSGTRQYPAWQEAMDAVGQSLSGFRQRDGAADTKAIAGFLTGQTRGAISVQRAALGLPLPFFFPQLHGQRNVKAGVNWYRNQSGAGGAEGKDQRSASPLLIHFTALADGSLVLLLTASYQDLIPVTPAGTPAGRIEIHGQSGDKRVEEVKTLDSDGYAALISRLQDTLEADLRASFRLVQY